MKKLLVSAWLLGVFSSAEAAFTDNQSAALELGQESMLLNLPNQQPWTVEDPVPTASTLLWPGGLIVAESKLLVADYLNNRVVIYDPLPVENGEDAAVVIGQPDMFHGELNQDPTGMDPNVPYAYTDWRADDVFYAEGRLLVADAFNNRVMVFDEVPAWNNASCQYVIGQPDAEGYLVANQGLVGGYAEAYTLYEPRRVCVDGGKVFVADRFNHRVLIYDSIPDWNNHSASVVVGQPDFIENKINQDYPCMEGGTGCPAQNTLQEPCGVYARDGRLFVSDTYNHRVLIYNSIPAWNNATADVVIGQADFFSGDPNRGLGAAYADTLDEPFGSVFYDGTRLFVPDSGNNRVLIYNSLPTENGQSADVVLGQPTMRDNFVNQFPPGPSPPPTPSGTVAPTTIPTPPPPPTSRTMYWPDGVFYQDGRLYVSDTHNNRVLIFLEFTPTPTPSPVPSATPTASPSPGRTPSPSASPTPSPRRSPTPTPSPSPPPSPSPAPSSSPTPSATPTPTPSPVPSATPTPTPSPSPSPTPSGTPPAHAGAVTGDYNGDGTSDIAVFRPGSGLWLIRNVTRVYFGTSTDLPVPRDYNGDGTWDPGVFRPSSGKWMVRGATTVYFGSSADTVVPADYNGNGTAAPALFRGASGKWLVWGVPAVYFGGAADIPVPADYDGNGSVDIAVFRPEAGKWMVRGGLTAYFGAASDTVLPADYDGDGSADIAVFRPANGKWMVRDGLSAYFGSSSDDPVAADYNGDGATDIAVFRAASGKWMVRSGITAYYGGANDQPVTNPWPRQ